MSKGLYIIIGEVLVFAIGVFILFLSAVYFIGLQNNIRDITAKDQLNELGDMLVANIMKNVELNATNATIRVRIPMTVSNDKYSIMLANGKLKLTSFDNLHVVEKELFNIGDNYVIQGYITSTPGELEIIVYDKTIRLNQKGESG
ncbi:MAG: hypothetical protein J4473_01270 [Candidatus Aenigmarchaeota archaeon]|nr:hypothetical protein [Candidatus Aenigmarchaeota archaeon]